MCPLCRSRVRSLKKFSDFIAVTFNVGFPTSVDQFTTYLRMRVSEPCIRGALKNTNQALGFLEEVSGMQRADRVHYHTDLPDRVQGASDGGLAWPGQALKQAPQLFVAMLPALERVVKDMKVPPYPRIYSWWMILQCWCTLRFSDHRGIKHSSISITTSAMSALLSRSKSHRDGQVGHITAHGVLDACCYMVHSAWL